MSALSGVLALCALAVAGGCNPTNNGGDAAADGSAVDAPGSDMGANPEGGSPDGGSDAAATDGAPADAFHATATSPRWGMVTENGARVSGTSMGMRTVMTSDGTTATGVAYDSNGDGRADEIDVNGDGLSDGEDIDGDGVITIWANIRTGDYTGFAEFANLLASTPSAGVMALAGADSLPGEGNGTITPGMTGGVEPVGGPCVDLGLVECGGRCVNPLTDGANCGACGRACNTAGDEVCSLGTCGFTCDSSLSQCGAACADTNTDPANCGACGNACAMGQACRMGACANVASTDAGVPDAAMPDAAMPDAAMPDAAMPDAAMPDAAMPDAAMPDVVTPEAGSDASGDAGRPVVLDPLGGVLTARQQGGLGSCAAFASAAAVTLLRYQRDRVMSPTVDIDTLWPSPLYIYQYNADFEANNTCSGTNISTNLTRFLQYGAPSEMELPYPNPSRDGNRMNCQGPTGPSTDLAATSPNRERFRIGGYVSIRATGMEFRNEVRRQLTMGRPVVFGVALPEGFMEYRATTASADGTVTNTNAPFVGRGMCTTSGHCGGHAMVITNYDDTRGAYRVLNSWGTDWGDRGYMWWQYQSLEQANPGAVAVYNLPSTITPLDASAPTVAVQGTPYVARIALPSDASGAHFAWVLFVRVRFSQPVRTLGSDTTVGSATERYVLDQGMLEGDVQALLPGSRDNASFTASTLSGQMASISLVYRTRSAPTTNAMSSLSVRIP